MLRMGSSSSEETAEDVSGSVPVGASDEAVGADSSGRALASGWEELIPSDAVDSGPPASGAWKPCMKLAQLGGADVPADDPAVQNQQVGPHAFGLSRIVGDLIGPPLAALAAVFAQIQSLFLLNVVVLFIDLVEGSLV